MRWDELRRDEMIGYDMRSGVEKEEIWEISKKMKKWYVKKWKNEEMSNR